MKEYIELEAVETALENENKLESDLINYLKINNLV